MERATVMYVDGHGSHDMTRSWQWGARLWPVMSSFHPRTYDRKRFAKVQVRNTRQMVPAPTPEAAYARCRPLAWVSRMKLTIPSGRAAQEAFPCGFSSCPAMLMRRYKVELENISLVGALSAVCCLSFGLRRGYRPMR